MIPCEYPKFSSSVWRTSCSSLCSEATLSTGGTGVVGSGSCGRRVVLQRKLWWEFPSSEVIGSLAAPSRAQALWGSIQNNKSHSVLHPKILQSFLLSFFFHRKKTTKNKPTTWISVVFKVFPIWSCMVCLGDDRAAAPVLPNKTQAAAAPPTAPRRAGAGPGPRHG